MISADGILSVSPAMTLKSVGIVAAWSMIAANQPRVSAVICENFSVKNFTVLFKIAFMLAFIEDMVSDLYDPGFAPVWCDICCVVIDSLSEARKSVSFE